MSLDPWEPVGEPPRADSIRLVPARPFGEAGRARMLVP